MKTHREKHGPSLQTKPRGPSREPLGSLGHFIASSTYAQAAPFGYPLARLRSALDGLDATKHLLSALSDSPHRDLRFTASGAFHPFAGRRHPDPLVEKI
mgnify:CR=1 FL=1